MCFDFARAFGLQMKLGKAIDDTQLRMQPPGWFLSCKLCRETTCSGKSAMLIQHYKWCKENGHVIAPAGLLGPLRQSVSNGIIATEIRIPP